MPVNEDQPWDGRLRDHARQYRARALGYPRTFGLIQRFLTTGVSDFAHIEMVHCALVEAGVADKDAPAVCLAWYASVIGLCMGEIAGLIQTATEAEAREMAQLPDGHFPRLRTLAPFYRALDPESVFEIANDVLIRGIAGQDRPTDA